MLVDTSVWVDHFRRAVPELQALLEADQVVTHPFVVGELCLGNIKERERVLLYLGELDTVPIVEEGQVRRLVERHRLWGRGLGWVDCHLLAAAKQGHAELMTRDKALQAAWAMVKNA